MAPTSATQCSFRRVVIKIGTNSIAKPTGGLFEERLRAIAHQCAALHARGTQVLIVSSGAVGLGVSQLALSKRPSELSSLQACAAIGQSTLMQAWQSAMAAANLQVAQVLLTRDDVTGRKRHVAIRDTLEQCLHFGVVPIINENDTVSVAELKFGDNDVLSALTASLVKADLLLILSTIDGLCDLDNGGQLIPLVTEIDDRIRALARGPENERATGGMITKIEAASIATRSGCTTIIANAAAPQPVLDALSGAPNGTVFLPSASPMAARKRWIAFFSQPKGAVRVDAGAANALRLHHRSLLPTGITLCHGNFLQGDVIEVQDPSGTPFARGLATFNAHDLAACAGSDSATLKARFPQRTRFEAVHRDSLVLL